MMKCIQNCMQTKDKNDTSKLRKTVLGGSKDYTPVLFMTNLDLSNIGIKKEQKKFSVTQKSD